MLNIIGIVLVLAVAGVLIYAAMQPDDFRIERSTNGVAYAEVATVSSNVVAWSDTSVAAQKQYFYRVRAANNGGNSAYANVASATTPAVVVDLIVDNADATGVAITSRPSRTWRSARSWSALMRSASGSATSGR